MNTKQAVAEKLLQINAIKLSVDKPFTWASGWQSPIYCDNRKILSFPELRDFIKSIMCDIIVHSFPAANILAGVATAGIPWAALAADKLKLPFIYVRPKAKEHGLGNQIEGFYQTGMKAVVIEDLISTGKSSLEVVKALKEQEIDIAGLVAIFSYEFEEAEMAFSEAHINCKFLSNYKTLVPLAIEKGFVSADTEETLQKWRQDPSAWGKSMAIRRR